MVRRAVLPLVALAGFAAAAGLIVGPPDLPAAWRFFVGGVPTLYEGEAVVALLCWLVVILVAAAALTLTVRAAGSARGARQPSARATLMLVAGVLLFGIALVHNALPHYSMCCASDAKHVQEAAQLVRR